MIELFYTIFCLSLYKNWLSWLNRLKLLLFIKWLSWNFLFQRFSKTNWLIIIRLGLNIERTIYLYCNLRSDFLFFPVINTEWSILYSIFIIISRLHLNIQSLLIIIIELLLWGWTVNWLFLNRLLMNSYCLDLVLFWFFRRRWLDVCNLYMNGLLFSKWETYPLVLWFLSTIFLRFLLFGWRWGCSLYIWAKDKTWTNYFLL